MGRRHFPTPFILNLHIKIPLPVRFRFQAETPKLWQVMKRFFCARPLAPVLFLPHHVFLASLLDLIGRYNSRTVDLHLHGSHMLCKSWSNGEVLLVGSGFGPLAVTYTVSPQITVPGLVWPAPRLELAISDWFDIIAPVIST